MMKTFRQWGANKVEVSQEVYEALEAIPEPYHKLLWDTVIAGRSAAKVHGDTHLTGDCIDISFKRGHWSRRIAYSLKFWLSQEFAVAFREGVNDYSTGSHLHCALKGKGNSKAILAANRADPYRNAHIINRLFDDKEGE